MSGAFRHARALISLFVKEGQIDLEAAATWIRLRPDSIDGDLSYGSQVGIALGCRNRAQIRPDIGITMGHRIADCRRPVAKFPLVLEAGS